MLFLPHGYARSFSFSSLALCPVHSCCLPRPPLFVSLLKVVDLEGGTPHSCVAVDASDGPPVIEALRHLARTQYGGAGGAVSASPESNNEDATALQGRQSDPSVAGSSSAEGGNSTSNTHNGSSGAVMSLHDGFSDVLKLEAVLSTHRHWDHTFGNAHLLKHVNSCTKVYGGAIDQVGVFLLLFLS